MQHEMRLAIQQTLLPGVNSTEKFYRAREWGLDGIEIALGGLDAPFPDCADDLFEAARAADIRLCSVCTTGEHDLVPPDAAEREYRVSNLAELLRACTVVGAAGVVTVHARKGIAREVAEETAITALRAILDADADGSAALFLEPLNRYETDYLRTLREAEDLAVRAAERGTTTGSGRVLTVGDLFHMNIEERSIAGAIRQRYARLGHLHLADSNRLLPGHGHTDFVEIFAACQEIGFNGWMALECAIPGDGNDTETLEYHLTRCVKYLRRAWEMGAEVREERAEYATDEEMEESS
jgi:sugar phosphate isomerase/epimerase